MNQALKIYYVYYIENNLIILDQLINRLTIFEALDGFII